VTGDAMTSGLPRYEAKYVCNAGASNAGRSLCVNHTWTGAHQILPSLSSHALSLSANQCDSNQNLSPASQNVEAVSRKRVRDGVAMYRVDAGLRDSASCECFMRMFREHVL